MATTSVTKVSIEATRYSDILRTLTLKDDTGAAIPLTGQTVNVLDVSEGITGLVTATITDAANGEIEINIEGTAPIDLGTHTFRLQVVDPLGGTTGGLSIGLPLFELKVV